MKKLMMFAALLCAAITVNAATVQWTASNISYSAAQADGSKYFAYLIDNGIGGYATAQDAFDALVANGTSALGVIHSAAVTDKSTSLALAVVGDLDKDPGYAAGDKITAWTIIVDNVSADLASNYMFSEKLNAGVNNSLKLAVAAGTQAGNTWVEAVPEPTSGLLMLLGMAGLALRRRRA